MAKEFDKEKLEQAARLIIEAVGDDATRPGLVETPKRFAKMIDEVLEGMKYTNQEIGEMFKKEFEIGSDDLVTMSDIDVFSYCEHHIALMYDMKVSVAYLPKNGRVLGLSKIARIADMCAKRLQLQEKIGMDIAECIKIATGSEDVMVVIEGKHACMTTRGIKKVNSVTRTSTTTGSFETDRSLEERAYILLGLK
ncbi:MAG: GTP cyclohydrolase I [Romboutsia timonensis]